MMTAHLSLCVLIHVKTTLKWINRKLKRMSFKLTTELKGNQTWIHKFLKDEVTVLNQAMVVRMILKRIAGIFFHGVQSFG